MACAVNSRRRSFSTKPFPGSDITLRRGRGGERATAKKKKRINNGFFVGSEIEVDTTTLRRPGDTYDVPYYLG